MFLLYLPARSKVYAKAVVICLPTINTLVNWIEPYNLPVINTIFLTSVHFYDSVVLCVMNTRISISGLNHLVRIAYCVWPRIVHSPFSIDDNDRNSWLKAGSRTVKIPCGNSKSIGKAQRHVVYWRRKWLEDGTSLAIPNVCMEVTCYFQWCIQ